MKFDLAGAALAEVAQLKSCAMAARHWRCMAMADIDRRPMSENIWHEVSL